MSNPLAGKFGYAGGMPERKVRPVWDAIDTRQYKNALKLASTLLTKYPKQPYAMAQTDKEAGESKGLSDKQVDLKIFAPDVHDISDQPSDIEGRIRTMALSYIKIPSCLILAVTSANSDLANLDALMAGIAEHNGYQTIGVITKLDITDGGTDARNFLLGKVIPQRIGYVGAVNLSREATHTAGSGQPQAGEGSSSSSYKAKPTFADLAKQLPKILAPSKCPLPQANVSGILLPIHINPHLEYRFSILYARTYGIVNGFHRLCALNICPNNYYLHWLALEPEQDFEYQLEFDNGILSADSELDRELNQRWASFSEPDVIKWRTQRWDRHGRLQPLYNQREYFHNACRLHQQVDIKVKMDETASSLSRYSLTRIVRHHRFNWRQANYARLVKMLTIKVKFQPRLICEPIDDRWCLKEIIFTCNGSLEIQSFPDMLPEERPPYYDEFRSPCRFA